MKGCHSLDLFLPHQTLLKNINYSHLSLYVLTFISEAYSIIKAPQEIRFNIIEQNAISFTEPALKSWYEGPNGPLSSSFLIAFFMNVPLQFDLIHILIFFHPGMS